MTKQWARQMIKKWQNMTKSHYFLGFPMVSRSPGSTKITHNHIVLMQIGPNRSVGLAMTNKICTGWWFGIFSIFFHILGIIIPTDEVIFFRGVGQPPTSVHMSWNFLLLIKSETRRDAEPPKFSQDDQQQSLAHFGKAWNGGVFFGGVLFALRGWAKAYEIDIIDGNIMPPVGFKIHKSQLYP